MIHFKDLILTIIYIVFQFIILFFIHYSYSDVFSYYLFFKLFRFKKIYAIQYYEIIFAETATAFFFTILSLLLLIWFHLLIYLITGLYTNEIKTLKKRWILGLSILATEGLFFFFFFLPLIIGQRELPIDATHVTGTSLIQVYSYGNITSLMIKLMLVWLITAIIIKIGVIIEIRQKSSSMSLKKDLLIKQRKSLPFILFIMSIWITPPEIRIQIMGLLILILYLEVHILISYWIRCYNRNTRG